MTNGGQGRRVMHCAGREKSTPALPEAAEGWESLERGHATVGMNEGPLCRRGSSPLRYTRPLSTPTEMDRWAMVPTPEDFGPERCAVGG